MREVSIKKFSNRHYAVVIEGKVIYEDINKKSCLKYLRRDKREFLKNHSKTLLEDVSEA